MRESIAVCIILFVVFTGSLISAESKQRKDISAPKDLTKDLAPLEASLEEAKSARDKRCQEFRESLSRGEIGRFQAISPMEKPFVFILDTKEGHIWVWSFQQDAIEYKGQICPVHSD